MKVLFVTMGIPDPPTVGAQIRDFELYRRMAVHHEVKIAALVESAPTSEPREDRIGPVHTLVVPTALRAGLLKRLPGHIAKRHPLATLPFVEADALGRLSALVREWAPDIVQFEHSFLAPYVDAARGLPNARTVLSLHNVGDIQYERMRTAASGWRERLGSNVKARLMQGWEARICERFERTVVVSETDRDRLLRQNPKLDVRVVVNGVDISQPPLGAVSGSELLFVGNFAYGPNVDAVRHFCVDILPQVRKRLPDSSFTAVGYDPPMSVLELGKLPGVSVAASVPDLLPYYKRAALCVVPLRAGGGTRLKILEAMAIGRPVVSTTIGCEGLQVEDGEHLLVADTPADFAQAIVDLCLDPAKAQRLSSRARRLCETQYGWDVAARQLEGVYRELSRY